MAAMTDQDLSRSVELFAKEAIAWSDEQSGDRIQAMEYYDGIMRDTPAGKDRSSVVSRDFRAATKKVLPTITRTIFGSEQVVEYTPVGEGDEQAADMASDYINLVVLPECRGEEAIRDAVHDALRIRNGILKWWWDKTTDVKVSKHSGLTPEELTVVAEADDVQIIEQSQDEQGMYAVTLKRLVTRGEPRIAAIPIEEFFISPDALAIEEAVFVAHNQKLKRYQLTAMGYDRARVAALPAYTGKYEQDEEARTRRDVDSDIRSADRIKDMEEIDYWECFVRIDADDDGIAELRRVVFAGGWNQSNLLENYECDEAPFTDVVIERRPHEWQGRSLFDDIHEIQRVKTVLLRETLDNIYWQNSLQPIINESMISPEGLDALYHPSFGKPIKLKAGAKWSDALGYAPVPFVAAQSFEMLSYMDDALSDRTGISDNSGGLPPDALQNVTAKASALMEQQGISQVELMVRNVATGLKRLFRGLLKLIIQHQDKPRMLRLSGKPVQFDPRSWDAGMDCTVNIGLGAGTRERDMMAMQLVNQTMGMLLQGFGPDNPFVKPDNVYNSVAKLYEAAGLKNVSPYITQPDPAEVQQKLEAMRNQPNPEQVKAEAQQALEQMKMQGQAQLEQVKAQTTMQMKQAELQMDAQRFAVESQKAIATEQAQMQADLQTKEADRQTQIQLKQMDHAFQWEVEMLKDRREREKMQYDAAKQAQQLEAQREMESRKLEHDASKTTYTTEASVAMKSAEQKAKAKQDKKPK